MTVAPRIASMLVVLCAIMPATGANAFESTGSIVGDHMLKLFEASGLKDLTYRSVSESGDQVTIDGLQGTMTEDGEELTMKIGNLGLVGGSVDSAKVLSVEKLELSAFSIISKQIAFTAEAMSSTGLKFPSPEKIRDKNAARRSANVYDSAVVTNFAVSTEDGLYLPVSEMRVTNTNYLGDIPRETTMSATNIELSTNNLPKSNVKSYLTDLGYETIRFDMSADSKWDDATGTINLPRVNITGKDFANITWSAKLGGWDADLLSKVTNLDPNNNEQAQEVMGKLQATSISNITIDVANKSIVDRILDQQSKKAGVDRAEFVNKTMSSLDGPLTFLRNENFQKMISSQLRAFLSDPKTLQVQVAPVSPIPIAQIVGMIAIAPQTLPDILGVSIEALQ